MLIRHAQDEEIIWFETYFTTKVQFERFRVFLNKNKWRKKEGKRNNVL